jgi:hypothetical protein
MISVSMGMMRIIDIALLEGSFHIAWARVGYEDALIAALGSILGIACDSPTKTLKTGPEP